MPRLITRRARRGVGLALVIAAVLALPWVVSDEYVIRVAVEAGLYIVLALGLNLVVGYCGLLDIGYVAFYAVGAYSYALLASPQFGLHLPFLAVLPVGGGLAAVLGIIIGFPTLRLRGDYLAIVTLGFGEMIRFLLNNLNGVTNGPQGVSGLDVPSLGAWQLAGPRDFYYPLAGLCALIGLVMWRVQGARVGRAWAAIREDEEAAVALGVHTHAYKLLAFACGAACAGVAGVIFAGEQGFVSPESFTFWQSIVILCMVVLGGMGSIPGVILGAVLLTILPEFLRAFSDWRLWIYGLALLLIAVFRPAGLWPTALRRREMAGVSFFRLPRTATGSRRPAPPPVVPSDAASPTVGPPTVGPVARALAAGLSLGDGTPLLELRGVGRSFGGLRAVEDVSFAVPAGAVLGLIGPNGAGKTTLLNLITATVRPTAGRILLDGRDLAGVPPHRMAGLGVARTWQNPRLFGAMSVLENVLAGTHSRTRAGLLVGLLGLPGARAEDRTARRRAEALLDEVGLGNLAAEPAAALAYGDQKRLELARALAAEPRLLLLDEPAAGLNSTEKTVLAATVQAVCRRGVTVMLIEHDMPMVMALSHALVVLDHGQIIAQGPPAAVRGDPRVIAAYLGSQGLAGQASGP